GPHNWAKRQQAPQVSYASMSSSVGRGEGHHHYTGIHKQLDQPSTKFCKYREDYIQYGFTSIIVNEVLAHESLKPVKILRHLKTKHSCLAAKSTNFLLKRQRIDIKCKSLDVSNFANLLVFVRYSFDGKLNKDMLFCAPLEAKCTGVDIFTKLDSELQEEGLSWGECIGVCTDSAASYKWHPTIRACCSTQKSNGFCEGKFSSRLYKLWDKVCLCLVVHGSQLMYLSRIFNKLSGLNMSLQGENILDRWTAQVEMDRINMFPELEEFMKENNLSVKTVKEFITSHLQALLEHFNKFFPEEMAPEKYDWIRSPFTVVTTSHLSSDMEDTLVELSSDRTVKIAFNSKPLSEFWISVEKEYPQLSRAAMAILMTFGCTYLCEKTVSALTYINNKYRWCLNVIDLLCSTHSAHPSH
uniref:HAT C-terminal dimerisation domain-containing protein n=1 Tax=Amphiprion percula TaxID=161767 RepID=A0A3P8UDJ8_AMPPE